MPPPPPPPPPLMESTEYDLAHLSLKDLRVLISEAGLSGDGCVDKADLRQRAQEGVSRLRLPGAKLGPVATRELPAWVETETAWTAKRSGEKLAAKEEAAAKYEAEKSMPEAEKEALRKADAAKAEVAKERARKEALAAKQAAAKDKAAAMKANAEVVAGLIAAVAAGDGEKVSSLLAEGIDVKLQAEDGNTALHEAAKRGLTPIAEQLCQAGADVNVRNGTELKESGFGFTPLHCAAIFNKVETGKLLLGRKADVFAKDNAENTPLDIAKMNKREEMVALLGEAVARIEADRAFEAKLEAEMAASEAARAKAAEDEEKARLAEAAIAPTRIGKEVGLHSLKAKPELNGAKGFVISYAADKGRYTIGLPSGEQIALKPVNLTF